MDRDTILKMTRFESQLRLSKDIQKLYDSLNRITRWSDSVEKYIQFQTLEKFGFSPTKTNLLEYQRTLEKYIDDEEIIQSVSYLKFAHLSKSPSLGPAIDCKVHRLTGQSVNLFDIFDSKPTIIMAGSLT